MKALKEGQMKNAIMDTVEDHCRNADIPEGSTYDQAVSFIVKSIMNTDTMAAELPSSELTEYVKEYFPKDEYEESVTEGQVKYTFQKINYGKFEQVSDSANDYDESAIDGARVLCAYDGKNCIAIYYAKAKTGSYCPEFKGDMMAFAEADTLCPLTEAHDTDMEFPKLLGKAGDFSVELNEGEKVSLMQRNKEIVSMPLVIWKQLSRV
jgi:hypothetical protein